MSFYDRNWCMCMWRVFHFSEKSKISSDQLLPLIEKIQFPFERLWFRKHEKLFPHISPKPKDYSVHLCSHYMALSRNDLHTLSVRGRVCNKSTIYHINSNFFPFFLLPSHVLPLSNQYRNGKVSLFAFLKRREKQSSAPPTCLIRVCMVVYKLKTN